MNFNRMTIRACGNFFEVFKMKRAQAGGYSTDMAGKRFTWSVSRAAKPQFSGSYEDCANFIEKEGAEYMSEHGLAC